MTTNKTEKNLRDELNHFSSHSHYFYLHRNEPEFTGNELNDIDVPRKFSGNGSPIQFELEAEKNDFIKRFGKEFSYKNCNGTPGWEYFEKETFRTFFMRVSDAILSSMAIKAMRKNPSFGRMFINNCTKANWGTRQNISNFLAETGKVELTVDCDIKSEYPALYLSVK